MNDTLFMALFPLLIFLSSASSCSLAPSTLWTGRRRGWSPVCSVTHLFDMEIGSATQSTPASSGTQFPSSHSSVSHSLLRSRPALHLARRSGAHGRLRNKRHNFLSSTSFKFKYQKDLAQEFLCMHAGSRRTHSQRQPLTSFTSHFFD